MPVKAALKKAKENLKFIIEAGRYSRSRDKKELEDRIIADGEMLDAAKKEIDKKLAARRALLEKDGLTEKQIKQTLKVIEKSLWYPYAH